MAVSELVVGCSSDLASGVFVCFLLAEADEPFLAGLLDAEDLAFAGFFSAVLAGALVAFLAGALVAVFFTGFFLAGALVAAFFVVAFLGAAFLVATFFAVVFVAVGFFTAAFFVLALAVAFLTAGLAAGLREFLAVVVFFLLDAGFLVAIAANMSVCYG
ncbi:MAG: hypothetical protein H6908_02940 [Hyphomicrobiales bacterium]|nr:hypothetical protein [Hyphomicrobiales bacterium]